jgi:hypothetical protein
MRRNQVYLFLFRFINGLYCYVGKFQTRIERKIVLFKILRLLHKYQQK